jgi:hypothetical protein
MQYVASCVRLNGTTWMAMVMVTIREKMFGDLMLVSQHPVPVHATDGVAPIPMAMVPVTPTSSWGGYLIPLALQMPSQMSQPSGKMPMAMVLAMSRPDWKVTVAEILLEPVEVTDSVVPIQMATVGPTKVTDLHMMPLNG